MTISVAYKGHAGVPAAEAHAEPEFQERQLRDDFSASRGLCVAIAMGCGFWLSVSIYVIRLIQG